MSLLVDEQSEFVGEKLECRGAGDQATVSGGKLTMPCGRVEAGLPRDDLVVSGKDAHKRHLVREGTPQIIAQRATTLAPQAASPKQARDAQGGAVALTDHQFGHAELMRRRHPRPPVPRSSFAGFRFPPDVIMLAVRWYLRYALSYRDVEELLAERGIEVDHLQGF
jgi:hypothetical protein